MARQLSRIMLGMTEGSFFLFLFENVCFVRPNLDELKSHLTDLGANYVITEEELKSSEMKEIMKVSCKRIV